MKRIFSIALLSLALMSFQACVIFETLSSASESSESASESLESVSKSVKSLASSINSSSESSSGDDEEKEAAQARYRQDVSELTALYASNAASGDYLHDLQRVARTHGITHWEASRSTYVAIGSGLRKAGLDKSQINKTLQNIPARAQLWIEQGYQGS